MSYQQRPQVPEPWVAEWDQRDNCWFYVNRQTGERTFQHPGQGGQSSYGGQHQQQRQEYGQGYGGQEPQYGQQRQEYGQNHGSQQPQYDQQQQYGQGERYQQQSQQQQPQKQDHAGRNTAFGVIGGLLGGALLMHEGEKVHERFEEDKYRIEGDVRRDENRFENGFERDKYRVENDVRRDEYRAENGFRRAEDDIVDAPEDIAAWGGRKVGDVERFGDRVDDAWDEGRNDRRYGDDNRYGRDDY